MSRYVTIKTTIEVEVSGNVATAGPNAHVLDAFIKGRAGEFLSLSRFDEATLVRVYNQMVNEALDRDRMEAENAAPFV